MKNNIEAIKVSLQRKNSQRTVYADYETHCSLSKLTNHVLERIIRTCRLI